MTNPPSGTTPVKYSPNRLFFLGARFSRPAGPKQVLSRIGRSYVFGREPPEERLGRMNRIKVVNKADAGTEQELYSRYRFLPTVHTDFLIDGFDESVLDALFDTGEWPPPEAAR